MRPAERYERVLAREPRHLHAYGRADPCTAAHVQLEWRGAALAAPAGRRSAAANDGRLSPFSMLSFPTTPAEQQSVHGGVGPMERRSDGSRSVPALGFDFSRRRARDRLRIGYLAWGLHRHATGYWAVELFELHDRAGCEVLAYSYGPDDGSDVRARIRSACDRFVDIARETRILPRRAGSTMTAWTCWSTSQAIRWGRVRKSSPCGRRRCR